VTPAIRELESQRTILVDLLGSRCAEMATELDAVRQRLLMANARIAELEAQIAGYPPLQEDLDGRN
jgi:hypothetical protein